MIVSGGGTGGHVFPAKSVVGALRDRVADAGGSLRVLWVGAADSLESRVAAAEGIEFHAVATGKIRRARNPLRMLSAANARDMARVPLGVAQARRIVADFAPTVVFTSGGYVAVPVGLAAALRRLPLVVHEQTTRLGLANRLLARAASRVAVSTDSTLPLLPSSARASAVVTGNPVRPELLAGNADKAVHALGLHGFDRALPTVYVTGGAQGAAQINTLVQTSLPQLLAASNVIHQCGTAHLDALRRSAAALPDALARRYLLTAFVGAELPDVLALADVVISRSGAGTLAELTALGKPAVLIPLASSAGGEQAYNARHLHEAGAALALLGEVSTQDLLAAVGPLLAGSGERAEMARRSRALGRPDAAQRLAEVVLAAAKDTAY